jgi:hypothetical protein
VTTSDTPETDAAVIASGGDWSPVLRETCRRLERERDEAREELENEMKWHHRTHKELVETQCKLLDIEYDKLKS